MITIQGSAQMQKQSVPPEYFLLNLETGFAHSSTRGSLADDNMELRSGNMGWCQIFHEIIICIKNFFISIKDNYSLKS